MMRRREFIALLGTAAAWPVSARAQVSARKQVGLLHPGQSAAAAARITAIQEGLIEGGSREPLIAVVVRLADGDLARLPGLARELIEGGVDAILAAAPPAVQAARAATTTVPIVAVDLESDPIASGFVASLARPGGNVTGVFLDFPDFSAKCLQLLTEAVPNLSKVAVLWDPSTGSLQLQAVEAAAQKLGVRIETLEAQRVADIADVFYALQSSRSQGALILSSPLFGGNPELVGQLATRRGIPSISLFPDIARAGGLLAYGPDIQELYRQMAGMARKVLRGSNPAELPVERPTRFKLVVNIRSAKALGLELPPTLLARADEVIE